MAATSSKAYSRESETSVPFCTGAPGEGPGMTPSPFPGGQPLIKDALLLLLLVLMCPVAIIIVGTPVALLVRLLIEIANRM